MVYSADEKEQIMLFGDLLDGSLTLQEQALLGEADTVHPQVQAKAQNLLRQGIRLGVCLEQLAQRGVQIIFPKDDQLSPTILAKFAMQPKLLFTLGSLSLLDAKEMAVFTQLDLALASTQPAVLIADRRFEQLLINPRVTQKVRADQLVIISDAWRQAARLMPAQPKRVFISGSRSQVDIPAVVQKSLDAIRRQNLAILIGDAATGVDHEILDYLRLPQVYPLVHIYTIGTNPRVSVAAGWQVERILADPNLSAQAQQMVKDRAMADAADWGLAVFDPLVKNRYGALQVSAGTLRNVIQLLLAHKAVKFFYHFEASMQVANLSRLDDLVSVLTRYRGEEMAQAEIDLIHSARGINEQADAAQVKSEKLMKKYQELLKSETARLNPGPKHGGSAEQISLFG